MKKTNNLKFNNFLKVFIILLAIVVLIVILWDNFCKNVDNLSHNSSNYSSTNNTSNTSNDIENWNLILVNKWNKIPDNYNVELVEVPGGEKVDKRIYEPLMQMLNDAKESNWNKEPIVVAGYRTNEKQTELYEERIEGYKKDGYSEKEAITEAEKWVSVPGYSEHQIGLAVDINGATYDLYFWLQENSYKYGFIFRYPGNKTDITGISEEVWHYRYVGKEVAKEIYDKGICLEEYLENIK